MGFPDGENVRYFYPTGGLVERVDGVRRGVTSIYVVQVLYDEQERRQRLEVGNGTKTAYACAEDTQRLSRLSMTGQRGNTQQLKYGYDLVGNITTLANKVDPPTSAPTGAILPRRTEQSFGYDDLYQLTSAADQYQGCASGCCNKRRYTLTTQYDGLGDITQTIAC